ncbi:hypothetical protein [Streptomyces sp. NBC_00338]|uniref:hypothetical protein n=1 Tax=unclassified Streptomyces TaxID=2593676 RepID=UPI002255D711|nr:hypothetical protein [Streptomyces sp. NBC_00338]MCX5144001.1 hypothetical protein [Streptomyces sp. NBC_00338]WSU62345.1 hypothetical protein OG450_32855 [Streptomyces sp. NBC_01104]
MRKKTTTAAVAALLTGALLLTGCGGDSDDKAGPPQPDNSIAPASSSLTTDLALPVEAYIFSESEIAQLTRAMSSLAVTCMKEAGFVYRPDDSQSPDIGVMDRRYGIANSHTAQAYGYHFPAPPVGRNSAVKALSEAARVTLSGESLADGTLDPEGGCIGKAKKRLAGGADAFGPDEVARTLNMSSYARSEKDPRVLAAFRTWSSCMTAKGYRYDSPMDAIDDQAFAGKKADQKEISTARADVECKKKTGLVRAWFDVESELQRTEIEKDPETFARIERQKTEQLKRAAVELGQSG